MSVSNPTIRWGISLAMALGVVLVCVASATAQRPRPPGGRPDRPANREGNLSVGDPAPDFALPSVDGKSRMQLGSFRGKRPVALIFGSYT